MMYGFLPLKNYKVVVNVQKEELICKLKNKIILQNLVRYNCLCYTNPRRLVGIISDDRIHVTSNANGFNACQLIMHGCVETIEKEQCVVRYRFIPNNYSILWNIALVLTFIFLKHSTWQSFGVVGLIFAVETILSLVSSAQTGTLFYEFVEETQKIKE